jgi:hypothetical protein
MVTAPAEPLRELQNPGKNNNKTNINNMLPDNHGGI